jgi:hypothetical protein
LIIAAGLAFATVLTLGVVPVLYAVLFNVKPTDGENLEGPALTRTVNPTG